MLGPFSGLPLPSCNTSGFFCNLQFVHKSQVQARGQRVTPRATGVAPVCPGMLGRGSGSRQHPPEELRLYSIGALSYSPPEWTHFGWYYGEAATVWSLGIVLHQMVCGEHPFRRGWNMSWGRLPLPQWLSPGGSSSLWHGGNSSAGSQQRAQEHPALAALRRWHMSCSPAALQKKELMGKFRHSSGHTQHGLGMARVGQSGQEPSASDWRFLVFLPRVPGCDKGVFIPALLGKALLRRPVV